MIIVVKGITTVLLSVLLLRCMYAQSVPSLPPRPVSTAVVDVKLSPQSSTVWIANILNESPYQVQFPRTRILIQPGCPTQLTKVQLANRQSNGFWAVAARSGQEALAVGPSVLTTVGITSKDPRYAFAGLAMTISGYLVQRATARSLQPTEDELPDTVALPAYGGVEYRLHTVKGKAAGAVTFQLQVMVP